MPRIVIIGGGISGLATGYELMERGVPRESIAILERAARPGGNLATRREDGYAVEAGPNGFLDNSPPTLDLVARLKMEDRLLVSDEAAAVRYLYSRGKLRKLPSGPGGMLTAGLVPLGGALRIFLEPFIRKGGGGEETVFDFAARRIGKAAAAILVDAMVSGVFAGNSRELELAAAFPKMAEMEAAHGSLTRAMIARKRERRREGGGDGAGPAGPGGTLTSFRHGFEELPGELAVRLGSSLRTGVEAVRVEPGSGSPYMVHPSDGTSHFADAVVLACPAWRAAVLVEGIDAELSGLLADIPTSPIAVVATAYDESDLGEPPRGFGFLVPREQGPRILGCLWTSSIWTGRAPDGKVLLRTMIGGAHDPSAMEMTDEELLETTARDLEKTMGLGAAPVRSWIFRYERGIAQYVPGHTARVARIREALEGHPGLFVAGSSYGGISVNHCVAEAPEVAERILASVSKDAQALGNH